MTDFFDDLERQLAAATPLRAQRLRRARLRRAAAVSTVLVALVAGGAGLASAIGGSDAGSSAGGGPAATAPPVTAPAPTPTTTSDALPVRGTYTVAVLNGTTIPGLARGVAIRLQNAKFKLGNITNAASQDRAQTRVAYVRPDRLAAAGEVARAIDVPLSALARATEAERTIAGDQADVIVTVGSDQNTSPRG
jgi:hypothetical protein